MIHCYVPPSLSSSDPRPTQPAQEESTEQQCMKRMEQSGGQSLLQHPCASLWPWSQVAVLGTGRGIRHTLLRGALVVGRAFLIEGVVQSTNRAGAPDRDTEKRHFTTGNDSWHSASSRQLEMSERRTSEQVCWVGWALPGSFSACGYWGLLLHLHTYSQSWEPGVGPKRKDRDQLWFRNTNTLSFPCTFLLHDLKNCLGIRNTADKLPHSYWVPFSG